MAITVDGRTDLEKLRELLLEPEQKHLEFKEQVDFSDDKVKLNLVKDLVALANCPLGGYLLVGVDNDRKLVLLTGTLDKTAREKFDGARLNDLVRKYTEGPIQIISQFHTLNGYEMVLIYVHREESSPPVPMSKIGQYKDGKNDRIVFREGEIWLREGAQNVLLRWQHWDDLLKARDQRVQQEARRDIDSLIAEIAKAVGSGSGRLPVPLSLGLADEAFVEALITNLEASHELRIRGFLGKVPSLAEADESFIPILDKISIVAVQTLYYKRESLAEEAVDTLREIYTNLETYMPEKRFQVIIRLYVIGAMAVRKRAWSFINNLVLRPQPSEVDYYTYSSWIRHGQVEASRAEIVPEKYRGSLMIPPARKLAMERASMCPDLPKLDEQSTHQICRRDPLLDSLCQFDILYCIIATAEGEHQGEGYPASSAYERDRIDPIISKLVSDQEMRTSLLPKSSDSKIASALKQVFELATRQSIPFAYWGSQMLPDLETFIQRNL